MKITARPDLRASLNSRLIRAAPLPTNISTKLEPEAAKKSTPAWAATAREAVWVAQPLSDVHQLVLGRVDSLNLLPEHRLGLARLHRLRLGRAHRAAHQLEEDEQQAGHEEDSEDRIPIEEEFLYFGRRDRLEQMHGFPSSQLGRHH
jgi:hypothetical protein